MRRPAQGGTSRPGPARPGGGYGRLVRPALVTRTEQSTDPAWWFERELELELGRIEALEADRSTERA
jgi:hypothetical protein